MSDNKASRLPSLRLQQAEVVQYAIRAAADRHLVTLLAFSIIRAEDRNKFGSGFASVVSRK